MSSYGNYYKTLKGRESTRTKLIFFKDKVSQIFEGWFAYIIHAKETEYMAKARLSECKSCSHNVRFLWLIRMCDMCGCILGAKARCKICECDESKWPV